MVRPRLAADREIQAAGLDLAIGFVADHALEGNEFGGDQAGAFAARAEALREQQLRQLHGGGRGLVRELEEDDVVRRRGPGAADDALVLELAGDGPAAANHFTLLELTS